MKFSHVASADTESKRSSNSSSSTSVGVSAGIGQRGAGLSLDVAASRGKGQANSYSTTYNNSHVSAGNPVNSIGHSRGTMTDVNTYNVLGAEGFNRSFRDEVLDANLFNSITQAQEAADAWVMDYNQFRPHDSLGDMTPMEFRSRAFKPGISSFDLPT